MDKFETGRIPSGIPDKVTDVSNFKVVEVKRPPSDGDFNDVIQQRGAHRISRIKMDWLIRMGVSGM